ncbi:helix-hairpin-helix domain-containing protein [bacterium]|nr:helix-hairpin-helix domain-containing protein [bacterium]MBU1434668.1 helix-hairpin-helix domain-containing protein [bacterium]MBU1502246.1 helix-hairpin-helix domain-containing protein [bacterium]
MHPSKVVRKNVKKLTDLPNIGVILAKKLHYIGIKSPQMLKGKKPLELYRLMCEQSGKREDPCLLDVLISITDFINGGEPRVWWYYTEERKKSYQI